MRTYAYNLAPGQSTFPPTVMSHWSCHISLKPHQVPTLWKKWFMIIFLEGTLWVSKWTSTWNDHCTLTFCCAMLVGNSEYQSPRSHCVTHMTQFRNTHFWCFFKSVYCPIQLRTITAKFHSASVKIQPISVSTWVIRQLYCSSTGTNKCSHWRRHTCTPIAGWLYLLWLSIT